MNARRSGPSGPEESVGGSGGRGVLLLAIAVVLGIIILQATDDDGGDTADVTAGTDVEESTSTTALTPTTLPQLRPPAEVKVLPANGTQTSGLGARVAEDLKSKGYINTLAAVDATTNTLEATVVEFSSPEFVADAVAVANILGLSPTAVKPLENPPPVRDTRDANVIVVAGKDLEHLASVSTSGSTTTTEG